MHRGCHVVVVSESTWQLAPWRSIGVPNYDSLYNRMWEVWPYVPSGIEMWAADKNDTDGSGNPKIPTQQPGAPTFEVCQWWMDKSSGTITITRNQPPGAFLTTLITGDPEDILYGVSARRAMMVEFTDTPSGTIHFWEVNIMGGFPWRRPPDWGHRWDWRVVFWADDTDDSEGHGTGWDAGGRLARIRTDDGTPTVGTSLSRNFSAGTGTPEVKSHSINGWNGTDSGQTGVPGLRISINPSGTNPTGKGLVLTSTILFDPGARRGIAVYAMGRGLWGIREFINAAPGKLNAPGDPDDDEPPHNMDGSYDNITDEALSGWLEHIMLPELPQDLLVLLWIGGFDPVQLDEDEWKEHYEDLRQRFVDNAPAGARVHFLHVAEPWLPPEDSPNDVGVKEKWEALARITWAVAEAHGDAYINMFERSGKFRNTRTNAPILAGSPPIFSQHVSYIGARYFMDLLVREIEHTRPRARAGSYRARRRG
jgi:hypothetical protein